MKKCPKCGQTYTDKDLNFCYNDGELLSYLADDAPTRAYSDRPGYADDPPPTEFMGSARVTQDTGWNPPQAPPVVWQGNQANQTNTPFSQYPTYVSPNQTLAIVSLGLGVGAVTIGWCCSSGFILSPAALVTGFIALNQIKKDPQLYSGKGFALGGIITAAIFLVIYLVIIIGYLIAALLSTVG
ncbi:MAG: DUF4190 domain-containing protein [Acidobacteria bacterium]|nr:DUF4190 domain-containing protein [Acidobacteriota bacterium]